MTTASRLRPNLVRPRAMHPKRRRNIIRMLAFSHTLNRKDTHLFERVMSQAAAISFHGQMLSLAIAQAWTICPQNF
jgi:hypothetical protein